MQRRRFLLAALAAPLAGWTAPMLAQNAVTFGDLEISGAFMRASPMAVGAGAGFLTITSKGGADVLLGFRSAACSQPELHTHIHEDGMMKMRQVPQITVPEGGNVALEPGGFHLMFIGLTGQLVEGDSVTATLIFQHAGEVEITLPVKGAGAMN